MNVTVPIYIEELPRGENQMAVFVTRPLHQAEPISRSERLSRALAQLHSQLQSHLLELSQDPRHDRLARWCLLPEYENSTIELRIELKNGSHQRCFFLAGYEVLGRKLFFTPKLPSLHFEVLREQRLSERAREVFTQYFRDLEKRGEAVDFDDYALPVGGKAFLSVLELKVKPALNALKTKPSERASIFGGDDKEPDGETELRKVGRLLNTLYPDDLPRAIGREKEVAELARWMRLPDRRAILLVGPRRVGKTAIVQEMLWRMMADKTGTRRRNFWLVSPMRLISGMNFVGQWEQRVEAICECIERYDSVLYLEDLPGLFSAGQSADSELNVAQLLKPRMEKRSMRLLAEITPESWRVVRERDRTFADLFHVVHVSEPSEADTLQILVSVAREMERQHACEFALEVVPTVYELYRRFASDAAFPGKAAEFLQRLALKHSEESCGRDAALEEFRERSGLQLSLLDSTQALDRDEIFRLLRADVEGQDDVLNAFADVLIKLKARLNDPRRPLAAFLLLGPTGVGKTQCAKALAKYLFGSAERLLRFDMNEMVDASALLRLVGSPREPDGLLSGAVRRQPFSVVLFDEIEKAAPEVFDLLLGVLDEGRLSDALGRVADFTSTVILLTSNLGVREAASRITFSQVSARDTEAAYLSAAEQFFRPEFFNRLDRVLPFRELDPTNLASITQHLLAELLQRDGLRQRQCVFSYTQAAAERLAALGHHPQLGARALKRVIEREVAQPLAAELACRVPGIPLRIELHCEGEKFSLHTREFVPLPRTVFWPERLARGEVAAGDVLDAAFAALDRLTAKVEVHAPAGKVELGSLTTVHEHYYHCREQIRRVEELLETAERTLAPVRTGRAMAVSRVKPVRVIVRQSFSGNPSFALAREAEAFQSALADTESLDHDIVDSPVFAFVRDLALLELMAAEPFADQAVGVVFSSHGEVVRDPACNLRLRLLTFLQEYWGAETSLVSGPVVTSGLSQTGLWAAGLNMARLLEPVLGTCLTQSRSGSISTQELALVPCATPEELERLIASPCPVPESPVVMTVRPDGQILSHRTGLVIPGAGEVDEYRAFHLAGLPLPAELAAVLGN